MPSTAASSSQRKRRSLPRDRGCRACRVRRPTGRAPDRALPDCPVDIYAMVYNNVWYTNFAGDESGSWSSSSICMPQERRPGTSARVFWPSSTSGRPRHEHTTPASRPDDAEAAHAGGLPPADTGPRPGLPELWDATALAVSGRPWHELMGPFATTPWWQTHLAAFEHFDCDAWIVPGPGPTPRQADMLAPIPDLWMRTPSKPRRCGARPRASCTPCRAAPGL